MLKFIVLWHIESQTPRKLLNHRCLLKSCNQPLGIFRELFGFNLLISVQVVNPGIQLFDNQFSLLSFLSSILLKVLEQNLCIKFVEACFEDMRFVLEESINCPLVLNIIENVSC